MQRKNLFFLLPCFVLALFIFTGCNKDKDQVKPAVKTQVAGVWKFESTRWVSFENGTVADDETDYGTTETIEFKSDGTVINKSINTTFTGTWALTDSDKKMMLSLDGESNVWDIKAVSASKLVLFHAMSEVEDGVTYKDEITISLKK
jgi:hypothetical protein